MKMKMVKYAISKVKVQACDEFGCGNEARICLKCLNKLQKTAYEDGFNDGKNLPEVQRRIKKTIVYKKMVETEFDKRMNTIEEMIKRIEKRK